MTPEAQRIAIAQACGWVIDPEHTRAWGSFGQWCIDPKDATGPVSKQNIPDYLNDLNAMHEAEMVFVISGPGSGIYRHQLEQVCGETNHAVFATAAQRAEAFLRVKGLWV